MQTSIALLGFIALSLSHLCQLYNSRKASGAMIGPEEIPKASVVLSPQLDLHRPTLSHAKLWIKTLSDFHKVQCFYSMALQIASCVAFFGSHTVRNRTDELYLLLVSTNGILLVTLSLYTLSLVREARSYDVALAGLSASSASLIGFSVLVAFPNTTNIGGDTWPETCGSYSPERICRYNLQYFHADLFFLVFAAACDLVLCCLISRHFVAVINSQRNVAQYTNKGLRNLEGRRILMAVLHTTATLILLSSAAVEVHFFRMLFYSSSIISLHDWSIGQILGIAIWLGIIIDLLRHEIGMYKLGCRSLLFVHHFCK